MAQRFQYFIGRRLVSDRIVTVSDAVDSSWERKLVFSYMWILWSSKIHTPGTPGHWCYSIRHWWLMFDDVWLILGNNGTLSAECQVPGQTSPQVSEVWWQSWPRPVSGFNLGLQRIHCFSDPRGPSRSGPADLWEAAEIQGSTWCCDVLLTDQSLQQRLLVEGPWVSGANAKSEAWHHPLQCIY